MTCCLVKSSKAIAKVGVYLCVCFWLAVSPPEFMRTLSQAIYLPLVLFWASVFVFWRFNQVQMVWICCLLIVYQMTLLWEPELALSEIVLIFFPLITCFQLVRFIFVKDYGITMRAVGEFTVVFVALGALLLSAYVTASSIDGLTVSLTLKAICIVLWFLCLIGLIQNPNERNVSYSIALCILSFAVWFRVPVNNTMATLLGVCFILSLVWDSVKMSYFDELTEIKCRRALFNEVPGFSAPLTVVMADIDHFKKFNDSYGHGIGDQVLRFVANEMNKVRGRGRAYRYGGEEFTLLFPGTTPEKALEFIEELRMRIANRHFVIRGKDRVISNEAERGKERRNNETVNVTVSFGIALCDEYCDFESAKKQADEGLYIAKRNGRNCCVIASS